MGIRLRSKGLTADADGPLKLLAVADTSASKRAISASKSAILVQADPSQASFCSNTTARSTLGPKQSLLTQVYTGDGKAFVKMSPFVDPAAQQGSNP